MIGHVFDPQLPYRYLRYGRMSDPGQNPRSPEQQFNTVDETKASLRLPWVWVADYRDDWISGRLIGRRPGLQQMLQDIRLERICVDLVLVDTFERFGRAEEIADLRRLLERDFGVLVLTADTSFADPTSVAGRMMSTFEGIRATEDGRIKGHNVRRGKLDAVRQKHWPGGPAPFGFRLESIFRELHGRQELDYSRLIRDPQTDWIMVLQFEKAAETGWGQARLARFLNEHPDIPAELKPFNEHTVGERLAETIYHGEYTYPRVSTAIFRDRRVITRNSEEQIIRVPEFCEPIVSRELWERANMARRLRAAKREAACDEQLATSDKLIQPVAPGLALKYLLSGLVRCSECGRAMDPVGSKVYTTKSGKQHRYVHYVCTGAASGSCPNRRRVAEEWLRTVVTNLIRTRLFGQSQT